jgi:hypothetical protein
MCWLREADAVLLTCLLVEARATAARQLVSDNPDARMVLVRVGMAGRGATVGTAESIIG